MTYKISEIHAFPTGIQAIVLNDEKVHGVNFSIPYCSCIGFSVRKDCKHLGFVAGYLRLHPSLFLEFEEVRTMKKKVIPSTLKFMRELYEGIPQAVLFGQFGTQQIGKTLTSLHFAYDTFQYLSKCNALFLDTEGTLAYDYLPDWVPTYNKRYKLDVGVDFWRLDYKAWKQEKNKGKDRSNVKLANLDNFFIKEPIGRKKDDPPKKHTIMVLDVDTIEKMNLLHGVPGNIEISEGGKTTLKPTPEWRLFEDLNPLEKIVREHNIKFICYDSLTQLLSYFIGGTANLPARHDAAMVLLTKAQQLTRENSLVTIINMHQSQAPTDSKGKTIKASGGKSVGHNFKNVLLHKESPVMGKTKMASFRLVKRIRRAKGLVKSAKYMITDNGIEDFK